MNNNFWFNYDKNNLENENNEPLVEIVEDKNENLTVLENDVKKSNKNKKKSASIKLSLGFIGIIILVILLNLDPKDKSVINGNYDNKNILENEAIKDKLLKGNYNFEYSLNLGDENGDIKTYTYKGSNLNGEVRGVFTSLDDINYLFKDNEYYIAYGDKYTLSNENVIYPVIDSKYLDIKNIFLYIDKAAQLYKTEYSNGFVEVGYEVLVSDLIVGNDSLDKIKIVALEGDNYVLDIDYTNLIKIHNENISSCYIKLTYEIIK